MKRPARPASLARIALSSILLPVVFACVPPSSGTDPNATGDLTGLDTNPGQGTGPVTVILRLPGAIGSVAVHPDIPGIGQTTITLQPGGESTLNFATCPEQISLGTVVFTSGTGGTDQQGPVVLDRGTDYACGQTLTITFSLPNNIALTLN
ncbi:MAG: hypothetical protein JXQ73_30345 [Phycisphaerae bacterium]|nr:hypothetical protein [Phycisphaerae bacterium]